MIETKDKKRSLNIAIPMILAVCLLIVVSFLGAGDSEEGGGFYQLVRLVVFTTCAIHVWDCYKKQRFGWLWFLALAGILFNPFAPVNMEDDIWRGVDFITGVVLAVYLLKNQKTNCVKIKDSVFPFLKKKSAEKSLAEGVEQSACDFSSRWASINVPDGQNRNLQLKKTRSSKWKAVAWCWGIVWLVMVLIVAKDLDVGNSSFSMGYFGGQILGSILWSFPVGYLIGSLLNRVARRKDKEMKGMK